ncbi:MAG: hypothetical protein WD768_06285 [Phycisphaeraceae bacterium]
MLIRSLRIALVALCALLLSGCLEIAGQRITLNYDAQKDELHILIQYDGIHDSGSPEHGKGEEQVAKAVKDGSVMIMDWPFTFDLVELQRAPVPNDQPEAIKAFTAAVQKDITISAVGYHRDPDGRVGGTQHIVIRHAKGFFVKANAAIDLGITMNESAPDPAFARTHEHIRKTAAKGGHQWLELDGHALKFSVPVHQREWATIKAKALGELIQQFLTWMPEDEKEDNQAVAAHLGMMLQPLTSMPLSYSETGNMVSLRLGDPSVPSTLRLKTGKTYKPNLEEAVERHVSRKTDPALVRALLGVKAEKDDAAVAAIASWIPHEDRVRAMMGAVRGNDPTQAAKAVAWLENFAEAWNQKEGLPAAPPPGKQTGIYLDAWAKWHGAMMRFPLPEVEASDDRR